MKDTFKFIGATIGTAALALLPLAAVIIAANKTTDHSGETEPEEHWPGDDYTPNPGYRWTDSNRWE